MKFSLTQGEFLVLSDLHIGHQASTVQKVESLRPLLKAGLTIIFNGDTFEMRRPADREKSIYLVPELNALLLESKVTGIFLNGNHDPMVSEINYLECPETGTLITHGDALFHNVAPWSRNRTFYQKAHQAEIAELLEHEKTDLTVRLAALRRATRSYDITHSVARPGLAGTAVHFLETAWPPWRPLSIIRSWIEIPSRAAEFVENYRPQSRNLLIGHSHFAGIWHRKNLRIINTGAAMTGFRPRAVRIESGKLMIHRLNWMEKRLKLARPASIFPDQPERCLQPASEPFYRGNLSQKNPG